MLCTGNLAQTVEKVPAPPEAEAEGTDCQQLATGQMRLEQGPSAFLLPMAMAQVSCTIYSQEQTENLAFGYVSGKKTKNCSYLVRCGTQRHQIPSSSLSLKLNW